MCACISCPATMILSRISIPRFLRYRFDLSFHFVSASFVFWVFGWIAFAILAYVVMTTKLPEHKQAFDPYLIMDLDTSATPKEIRKQYRRLSLKWYRNKFF
jgi:preprotein translocase subunit Sec63